MLMISASVRELLYPYQNESFVALWESLWFDSPYMIGYP